MPQPVTAAKPKAQMVTRPSAVAGHPSDSPWKPFADRRRDRARKRDAVLKAAAGLFLEVGYDRGSLSEVAQRLNITKPALYNYFPDKEAILLECYRLGQERVSQAVAEIDAAGQSGLKRVRSFILAYALIMTEDFGMCLVRLDDRVLAPTDRARVRAEKRRIDEALRRYLADGIADGSIVACDTKLSAFILFGALHGIGHWYSAAGELEPESIALRYAEALTAGLARDESQRIDESAAPDPPRRSTKTRR